MNSIRCYRRVRYHTATTRRGTCSHAYSFRKCACMRIAIRIRQFRLEQMLSVEDLAVEAQMAPSLLSTIENGREIPSWEIVERLAAAMGVSTASLFFDDPASVLTPWLTPRLTLQQLADEPIHSHSSPPFSLLKPQRFRAAARALLSFVTNGRRRFAGETPQPLIPSADRCEQDRAPHTTDRNGIKPKP